jgi:hypothetical protein
MRAVLSADVRATGDCQDFYLFVCSAHRRFPPCGNTLVRASRHRFDGPAKFMAMKSGSEHRRRSRDRVPLTDRDWPIAECRFVETEVVKSCHSFSATAGLFPTVPLTRVHPDCARTGMRFASLGRAFQADGRGFSPIEGGLEGDGSVS